MDANNLLAMRKVVILQSNYIPWKGYFDLINDADVFVFYDEVQFTKNDWRNRNKIKTASGCTWLSVPVGKCIKRSIYEVLISNSEWQCKHLKSLQNAYASCSYYHRYAYLLDKIYRENEWKRLSELNQYAIRAISEALEIKTIFATSDKVDCKGDKNEKLVAIIQSVGGDSYLTGPAAKAYLDEEVFRSNGIELIWKDYSGYPEYKQKYPPFNHLVTVLDLIFNEGPNAAEYIWKWRTKRI